MIEVGGKPFGSGLGDTEFCGLVYPEGDKITKNLAKRLKEEPFYRYDKLEQALRIVRGRRVAVDCGAWVGAWSRELAKHFGRVIAIEANGDNARCARKNLAGCLNAEVIHTALGDVETEALACAEESGGNIGSRLVEGYGGRFAVAMRPLDNLPAIRALDAIDYLKVHVNGMELRALRGAAGTIRKHRPIMTVVVKDAIERYDSREAIWAFLAGDLGYKQVGGAHVYEIWGPK